MCSCKVKIVQHRDCTAMWYFRLKYCTFVAYIIYSYLYVCARDYYIYENNNLMILDDTSLILTCNIISLWGIFLITNSLDTESLNINTRLPVCGMYFSAFDSSHADGWYCVVICVVTLVWYTHKIQSSTNHCLFM